MKLPVGFSWLRLAETPKKFGLKEIVLCHPRCVTFSAAHTLLASTLLGFANDPLEESEVLLPLFYVEQLDNNKSVELRSGSALQIIRDPSNRSRRAPPR
jgi:hypothetical protein